MNVIDKSKKTQNILSFPWKGDREEGKYFIVCYEDDPAKN